jgi:hypothetical protein
MIDREVNPCFNSSKPQHHSSSRSRGLASVDREYFTRHDALLVIGPDKICCHSYKINTPRYVIGITYPLRYASVLLQSPSKAERFLARQKGEGIPDALKCSQAFNEALYLVCRGLPVQFISAV